MGRKVEVKARVLVCILIDSDTPELVTAFGAVG